MIDKTQNKQKAHVNALAGAADLEGFEFEITPH
jgi:hypothetical protein